MENYVIHIKLIDGPRSGTLGASTLGGQKTQRQENYKAIMFVFFKKKHFTLKVKANFDNLNLKYFNVGDTQNE